MISVTQRKPSCATTKFFFSRLDGLPLPTTPSTGCQCWTAGGYQQLKQFTQERLKQGDPRNTTDGIGWKVDDRWPLKHITPDLRREKHNLHLSLNKLMLFTVSKDEWNTKEDTGKSLKNALHKLPFAKRHLLS